MRTERFNGSLLSTLIIVSLIVPAITVLSISPASASPGPDNIIVKGDAEAFNYNTTGPPPWQMYEAGDNPPIMAAKQVDNGRVVAAGFARGTNGGENYPGKKNWGYGVGGLDVLFDVAFRWMKPDNIAPIKVLWYGKAGENYNVFNDALKATLLIESLRAKGYIIENTGVTPINSSLLAPYDILVQPGFQLGDFDTGGDPALLPDADVEAIDSFVRGGGGLFIMESGDWDGANFYKVQNKILEKLDFGMYFQMDTVVDPDSLDGTYETPEGYGAVFDADVTNVLFGDNYITATGNTRVQVYKVPSLAPAPEEYGVYVKISPSYLEGLAEGTLEYEVKVYNVGKTKDNFLLENSDTAGWDLEISPETLEIENGGKFKYATLRVTIPPGTSIGTVDNVTITATSEDNENASHSTQTLAITGNRIKPTIADAQVVEADPARNFGSKGWMYVGSSATGEFKNEQVFLKFDLEAMGMASVDNVRLFLYCFALMGAPDKNVQLHRVNVSWEENSISWDTKPSLGDVLANATGIDENLWYSWDVTSYVQERRGQDNLANFALSYETPSASYPDNFSYGFDAKEYREALQHPYLAVGRSVRTVVRPDYKEGLPGGTLSYDVLVQNTGAIYDTYNLENYDDAGWDLTISPTSLELAPGALGTATVSVKIPSDAPIGDGIDNLLVIATSTSDENVSDNYCFVANVSNTNIGPPDDDSSAMEAEPSGYWVRGTAPAIFVGRDSGGPTRGFLKFDLSAIGTDIASARLWLTAEDVDDVGAVVIVHEVDDDSWTERSSGAGRLMWDNQPSIGENLDIRGVVEADKQYFWDVTSYVLEQRAVDNVVSFALVDLGENISPNVHKANFTSKESEITENHPYLEILTTEPTRAVRAYISPIFQGGITGKTLDYTVTVKNTGTSNDTYDLTVDDDWGATVLPTSLSINAGDSDNAMLSVTVPAGTVCTLDEITVTATSQAVGSVKDSAVAFAHLSGVEFKLENLYKIKLRQLVGITEIPINLRLREDADKLVAKFKTYGGGDQGENVIYDNIFPWHLTGIFGVPHPQGASYPTAVPVERVELVLVDGTGAELATVATFIANRNILSSLLVDIYLEWPFAPPDRKNHLFRETSDLYLQWPFAPLV